MTTYDCTDEKDRIKSKNVFKQLKTPESFFNMWGKFYENKICTPGYNANFVGSSDNPQATFNIGKKFKEITSYKIIPHNFQTNSLEKGQKAYVNMFVPYILSRYLPRYINRYPGYVAFFQPIEGYAGPLDLFVTYDATPEEVKMTKKTGVLFGEETTAIGDDGKETFDFIQEWLNDSVKSKLGKYMQVTVIDTIPSENQSRILDMILTALKDKASYQKFLNKDQ